MKNLYRNADGFVFQTIDAQNFYKNIIKCKTKIIGNPLNEKFIKEDYSHNRDKVIVTVGRLEIQKNQSFLIDVFEEYSKRNTDSYLFIIGNGSLKNELEAKIKQSAHKDQIFLLEARSDIENYYMAADYFLLPSLYEGVPFVGIEAQASGLKCIFSTGTPKESKIIDTTVFLPNSVDEWVEQITHANSDEERTSLNKTRSVKEFDIKQSVEKLEEIYDSN